MPSLGKSQRIGLEGVLWRFDTLPYPFFSVWGRSQISARIGVRQSNKRGNLTRGVS